MRSNWENIEYRRFMGLDQRTDKTLLFPNFLQKCNNRILERGVIKTRLGSTRWGYSDFTAISGTFHTMKTVDVGANEYVLAHIGTKIYYCLKNTIIPLPVQNIAGGDLVVYDADSAIEVFGKQVGTSGQLSLKVIVRQALGCTMLEWNNTSWIGRNPGIANTATFTLSTISGGNATLGDYRVRVVAQRTVNGIRVQESAPISSNGAGNVDSYQTVTLAGANKQIRITITDGSADAQITHYMIQVTRALTFTGDSPYSDNGNDPTIYFETTPIVKATALGGAVTVNIDSLTIPVQNLYGYQPIPGHVIGKATGGKYFFGGVAPHKNRIYKVGVDGYYYHNELYSEIEYYTAGDDDGQFLTGLGVVQDHLAVFKEAKTGIIPNRSLDANIVWRDEKIGTTAFNCFANISEDEMIVYCSDGLVRVFNGIQFDKRKTVLDGVSVHFSDAVRPTTEAIDHTTIEWVFKDERLHLIYGALGARKALVLHPRDGYAWTTWDNLSHFSNVMVDNGQTWLFWNAGRIYQQNTNAVYTDNGVEITWTDRYSPLFSQVSRKDKVLVKIGAIDGDFTKQFTGRYICDEGLKESAEMGAMPNPETLGDGYTPWFKINSDISTHGNQVELELTGTGESSVRGVNWTYVNKPSGNLSWSVDPTKQVQNPTILQDTLTSEQILQDSLTGIESFQEVI